MADTSSSFEKLAVTSSLGKKLFCKYWDISDSKNEPRALAFICHGFGEHCMWYDRLACSLNQEQIFCFSHDHVGHGQSEGDRVHIDDFFTYVQDVLLHINKVRKTYPSIPLFIIGHSMGGTITIRVVEQNPELFRGTILISPCIIPSKEVANSWMRMVARIMGSVTPHFQMGGTDPTLVSRDKDIVEIYKNDPLVWHGGFKAKWGVCMLDTLSDLQEKLEQIKWPFLLLHGTSDRICNIEGSQLMFSKAKSKDKEYKEYEGFYHQLHNEPHEDRESVCKDIIDWIIARY